MSREQVIPTDPNVIAALHQAGRTWRALAGRRENGRIRVLESREFRADEAGRLEDWLTQHHVSRTICVLPAASVICRTATLPGSSPELLGPALRLQAETLMLGTAPPHRQAMAVLHAAPGESSRSGIIVAWPEKTARPTPPTSKPITFAPDIACLAALMNGVRSNDPIMWTDRTDGSVALALAHPQGAVFRAACENSENDSEWQGGVNRLLVETALNVGHSEAFTDALVAGTETWLARVNGVGGQLLLPAKISEAAASRIDGIGSEPGWWSKYGVAAGALLATLDQLEPLTAIRDALPVVKPSRLARVASALSSRRAAAIWVVVAILALGFSPLLFNGARVAMYRMRVGNLEVYQSELEERESRLVMYEELSRHAWPVAKLLADVANCAPQGVSITSINIDVPGNEVAIQGEADSESIANEMGVRMGDAGIDRAGDVGIFSDVQVGFNNREAGSAKFKITITAKVRKPYDRAEYEDDFAVDPLGRRMYGERFAWEPTRTTDAPREQPAEDVGVIADKGEEDVADEGNEGDETDVATGPERNGNGPGNRGDFGRTGPRSSRPPVNIPSAAQGGNKPREIEMPPIRTADEIGALTHAQVQEAMLKIIEVRDSAGVTDEQRSQLKEQFDLLMKQLRAVAPLNGN